MTRLFESGSAKLDAMRCWPKKNGASSARGTSRCTILAVADSATMATHSGDTLYLIYHNVPKEDVAYTYAVSAELLRQHLAVVREGHANPHLNASITFDDGHRTQFENALPVLTAAGVKATFFVTAGWTDQEKDSMTAQQLRQLSDAGHTIGAHGLTHKLLTQCSAEELKAELAGAKTRLEQAIGKPVTSLSMPGGRYNRRVLEACAEQGYRSVFTSDPVTEIEDWQGL